MIALLLAACGAPVTPAPAVGPLDRPLANTTWESPKLTLVFDAEGRPSMQWPSMVGAPVRGTAGRKGDQLHIQWDPEATNTLNEAFLISAKGPCSLELTEQVRKRGPAATTTPVFVQTSPPCP